MYQIICHSCDKTFTHKDRRQKFCSRNCYDRNRIELSLEKRRRICPTCNKEFYTDSQMREIYCSRECFAVRPLKRIILDCPQCGKTFDKSPSTISKFCSANCYHRSKMNKMRPCANCGQSFHPEKDAGKYCSRVCSAIAHKTKTELRTCSQCSKEFVSDKGRAIYCSVKCYGIAQRGLAKRSGLNFTNAQRKAIKTRDNNRCVKCGEIGKLELDHITPVALGGLNTIENGQTLCHHCHAKKTKFDLAKIRKMKKELP